MRSQSRRNHTQTRVQNGGGREAERAENSAMFYVISMETRVELWVILTHNSLFRHTCRVVL